ncbi:MAG: hypothetical protein K940chlam7_01951, partial [Chlamydiae bacterium]|nr:hypothetical protein [Chlamydiota bacterium]
MSFDFDKFEAIQGFVNEIAKLPQDKLIPQKEGLVKKAEAFGRDIQQLNSADKKDSITRIQRALKELYKQVGQSEHSISVTKTSPSKEVTAKIEILRTMLYGSGLEEMPSIRRFKAFVDLA